MYSLAESSSVKPSTGFPQGGKAHLPALMSTRLTIPAMGFMAMLVRAAAVSCGVMGMFMVVVSFQEAGSVKLYELSGTVHKPRTVVLFSRGS
jgi:hypothetical protein